MKKPGPDRHRWRQFLFYGFEITQVILACFTFGWGAMRLWRFFRKS